MLDLLRGAHIPPPRGGGWRSASIPRPSDPGGTGKAG